MEMKAHNFFIYHNIYHIYHHIYFFSSQFIGAVFRVHFGGAGAASYYTSTSHSRQHEVTYVQCGRQKLVMFTMQLNDFFQVDEDVVDVLWREDPVPVHPLVENSI